MIKKAMDKLLNDPRVIDEINKHKWFQSEKAGHDIGFEQAAQDWINRYAEQWKRAHSISAPETSAQSAKPKGRPATKATRARKKR